MPAQGDPQLQRTADWCRDFLARRGFDAVVIKDPGQAPGVSPVWALEVTESCEFAASLNVPVDSLRVARSDAFMLTVRNTSQRPVISIVGKNATGVRSGVARLIALLRDTDGRLELAATREIRSPFFPIREIMIANRGKVFNDTPWEDTYWQRWPDERIRRYAEQLWLMGFNSIQLTEGRSFRADDRDNAETLAAIAHKLQVLMTAARENGLLVSHMIWGQAPFNRKICWTAPDTRAVMENEFRWMARTYGPHVDHVVMHMRDPGGCACGTCDDYRVPQEIAAFVLAEYRKANPRVSLTLSTWFLRDFWKHAPGVKYLDDTTVQFWTGSPDTRFLRPEAVAVVPGAPAVRFLDDSFMPREAGIALHKWYDADKAKSIRDAGRVADIWSWYMSDQETTSDMSLCMQRVDRYFSSLPGCASNDVRRLSTELCFHGWPQVLNAYVSAQKMWSPERSLEEIEREFCAGMFGDENAGAMLALYQACELIVFPSRVDACLPRLDVVWGNPEYNRRFRRALELGRTVRFDDQRPPRFTAATAPAELHEYLMQNLSLAATLSQAQEEIKAAKAGREEMETIVRRAEKSVAPYRDDPDYDGLLALLKESIADPDN